MYDATLIKAGLLPLVGWKQNPEPTGLQLDPVSGGIMDADSGLYFNDYHPLLTHENLIAIAPDFDLIYDDWVTADGWVVDDIVYYTVNRLFYKSKTIHSSATDPAADTTNWAEHLPYSVWLQEKTEGYLMQIFERWFYEKSELRTATNLLAKNKLFNVSGNITDVVDVKGNIVGIEIKPTRSSNLQIHINQLALHVNTNQTINVYLFKSGYLNPVKTYSAVCNTANSIQWFDLATEGWILNGESVYFIAYDDSLITGKAINGVKDYNYNNRGGNAFPGGLYFKATAFDASGTAGDTTLWDIKDNAYTLSSNYGINIDFSVHCEYTGIILQQKSLFQTAIGLGVAMNMLNELAYNPNSKVNRNEANINRSELLFDLFGDSPETTELSVTGRLKKAIEAVYFDLSLIDPTCLPCKRNRIRHKAIGPVANYGTVY